MIVGFVDVVRSTAAIELDGFRATLRIREQLHELTDMLGMIGPPPLAHGHGGPILEPDGPGRGGLELIPMDCDQRFVGERQGDGFVFAGPRSSALIYLKEVLKIQMTTWMHAEWMPIRFSIGIATAMWDGEPWASGSTFNGRDVTIVARLLDQCPPNGVVINRELHKLLWEHAPELRTLFCEKSADIQGFDVSEIFWVHRSSRRKIDAMTPKIMMALLAGMMLLLATHVASSWHSSTQFKEQTTNMERLSGTIEALIWTLCETAPECKPSNVAEPPYMKIMREKFRKQAPPAQPAPPAR